jgi:cellulose synthase/poly-beta-1,6-N-acetylglucosamine synthase-like glycosyltransferase
LTTIPLLVKVILNTLHRQLDFDPMPLFLIFCSVVYIGMLVWLYYGLGQNDPLPQPPCSLSVIIAVRDAEGVLPHCLESLLQQEYPQPFEIIIADDGSTDGSFEIAVEWCRRHPRGRVIQTRGETSWQSSKKAALQKAILLATGELLFFTDADCLPPRHWLKTMAAYFDNEVVLVAGFSPQIRPDRPDWHNFLFTDSLSAALAAAGTIGRQIGVTCTGRNLAYRRSAWLAAEGFTRLPDTLSGDDDFILREMTPLGRIRYCLHPQAMVPAIGPVDLKTFLRQKRRHLSAGSHYRFPARCGYALYHSLNALLWTTIPLSLLFSPWYLLFFLIKLAADYSIMSRFSCKFDKRLLLSGFIIWQFVFLFYHALAAVRLHRSPPRWQGF